MGSCWGSDSNSLSEYDSDVTQSDQWSDTLADNAEFTTNVSDLPKWADQYSESSIAGYAIAGYMIASNGIYDGKWNKATSLISCIS